MTKSKAEKRKQGRPKKPAGPRLGARAWYWMVCNELDWPTNYWLEKRFDLASKTDGQTSLEITHRWRGYSRGIVPGDGVIEVVGNMCPAATKLFQKPFWDLLDVNPNHVERILEIIALLPREPVEQVTGRFDIFSKRARSYFWVRKGTVQTLLRRGDLDALTLSIALFKLSENFGNPLGVRNLIGCGQRLFLNLTIETPFRHIVRPLCEHLCEHVWVTSLLSDELPHLTKDLGLLIQIRDSAIAMLDWCFPHKTLKSYRQQYLYLFERYGFQKAIEQVLPFYENRARKEFRKTNFSKWFLREIKKLPQHTTFYAWIDEDLKDSNNP